MPRICLIGNSGRLSHVIDGQTTKLSIYQKKIQDEGFEVSFIELDHFLRHPISTLSKIKKAIKICDRIVLIAAQRGCKILIPFINHYNKKYKKPFILPLIGTSVLHYSIDKLSDEEKNDFLLNGNYSLCKPNKKMSKELSKITYILPETDLLTKVFSEFYQITNVRTLNNFRENAAVTNESKKNEGKLKLVFLSRVMREKGIFDLLDVTNNLLNNGVELELDIYGKLLLSNEDEAIFNKSLNDRVHYKGCVEFEKVINTLANYDLFIFPTRFVGEGTPGVISESLIAGTPVISSNFPQAKLLMKDGVDSLFYKMGDKKDLENRILCLLYNPKVLSKMKIEAMKSGEHFLYKHERDTFLKYICVE